MSLVTVLTALADTIRSKSGRSGPMTLEQMAEAVNGIQQEGIDTNLPEEEAATSVDIVKGKSAWVNGEKVTGSIPFYNALAGVNIVPKLSSKGDAVALLTIIDKKHGYFAGSEVSLLSPLTNFGDAGVGDVSAGKTFTSSSGLKAVGTRTEPVIRFANNVLSIT